MKNILLAGLVCGLGLTAASAQEIKPGKAKPAEPKKTKPLARAPLAPVVESAGEDYYPALNGVPPLNGVVVVDSTSAVKPGGAAGVRGVVVHAPAFLKNTRFNAVVKPYLGKPMSKNQLKKLQREIILFCRAHDHPLVDVMLMEQELADGVIQLAVVDGKLGKIEVENKGRKWYSDEFVQGKVRLKPGDSITESKLLADVTWLNRNPVFREVNVALTPGKVIGETDVQLRVEDRTPLRMSVGYDNAGTKVLGEHRMLGGFDWGNAFGLDHQLNYQFASDVEFQFLKSHSASYVIPLPWRHTISLFGDYTDAKANLNAIGFTGFSSQAKNYQASLRYGVPLPRISKIAHELSIGVDFKETKSDFEFGGITLFATPTDVMQAVLGYQASVSDDYGETKLGAQGFYSPGGLFGAANSRANYQATRAALSPHYIYTRLELRRNTGLPAGFSWEARGTAQLSDGALLASEQFGLGGYDTVRGFQERVGNGDEGWVVRNELLTPKWEFGHWLGRDLAQFLVFYDFGTSRLKNLQPGDNPHVYLSSVGAGLRVQLGRNLTGRVDYGYQISRDSALLVLPGFEPSRHRVHGAVQIFF